MHDDVAVAPTVAIPPVTDEPDPAPPAPARSGASVLGLIAEGAIALGAAAVLTLLSTSVNVNPLDRIGQVSGLAGIQLRFAVLGVLVIAAVLVVSRLRGLGTLPTLTRFGSAAIAGLASGFTAGGLVLALRGTSEPLNATRAGGDFSAIAGWAESIIAGHSTMPNFYPPLPVYVVAWLSELTGQPVAFSFKDLEIVGTALFGPVAYLAWRLLLRPLPALVIGVVSALPLVYPYKPYENLVLIALIPILIRVLQNVRNAPERSHKQLILPGVITGLALGICFLSYSGWFVWSAPGFFVAVLCLAPWKRGLPKAITYVAISGVVMLALCWRQIASLLHAGTTVKDNYFYFDTLTDPAYFAMWRGDLPGDVGLWPPPGELGGVGLYTIILFAGLALALFLALRNPIVVTLACCFGGAWLLRFYFASQMYQAQSVQLYPRTTMEIVYTLLVLTLFAVLTSWERVRDWLTARGQGGMFGLTGGVVGAFAALLLVFGSAGSATANNYLPRNDNSEGHLAWVGQTERMPNGHCSVYLQDDCTTPVGTPGK
ncbi:hypothetical protein [Kutzneria sp. NPDC052558]|uniref:hypothetical protein n=1 Tax=Kutzneria sp. NPDC052558 TaxID=3364121 RepID=UPI0037CB4DEC